MRSDRQQNYQYYNQCNIIFPNWEKSSEFPAEGAVLEGGEERVQLRQRRLRPVQHLRYPPLLRRCSAGGGSGISSFARKFSGTRR